MTVLHGDCLEVLPGLPADTFDSCVTDPPYHLVSIVKRFAKSPARNEKTLGVGPFGRTAKGFMGKTWDGGDVAMRPETWAEVLRVLKPGAHMLAFGGSRTFHRIWCAIEDAGFEVRDTLMWLYGSGFPKSHDAGDGWGTALKPAFEPIILARKPLIGTVAENVLAHGTGAINIDASRVATEESLGGGAYAKNATARGDLWGAKAGNSWKRGGAGDFKQPEGRWPANVLHDGSDEVLAAFPHTASGTLTPEMNVKPSTGWPGGSQADRVKNTFTANSGSAARFFYCAKASKADRNEGCDALADKPAGMVSETSGQHITRRDGGAPTVTKNNHPTVKPEALMRYLVKLVTPVGGVVLDPFTGSGSTGKAAVLEGFGFTGIEREDEYVPIAKARIAAAAKERYDEVFS